MARHGRSFPIRAHYGLPPAWVGRYSASAAATIGGITAAASAQYRSVSNGTCAATIGGITAAASTQYVSHSSGTASPTLGGITASATVHGAAPVYTASIAANVGHITASATATFRHPFRPWMAINSNVLIGKGGLHLSA